MKVHVLSWLHAWKSVEDPSQTPRRLSSGSTVSVRWWHAVQQPVRMLWRSRYTCGMGRKSEHGGAVPTSREPELSHGLRLQQKLFEMAACLWLHRCHTRMPDDATRRTHVNICHRHQQLGHCIKLKQTVAWRRALHRGSCATKHDPSLPDISIWRQTTDSRAGLGSVC